MGRWGFPAAENPAKTGGKGQRMQEIKGDPAIRVVTLLENTAEREDLAFAHGLSLYIETPRHKILFDMGPNEDFLANAEQLGVDLAAVDLAILSHGHYDHSGGLAAFCRKNSTAPIYLREGAFGAYYALEGGAEPRYIGLDPALIEFRDRFHFTKKETVIDEELTLFACPPMDFDALGASAMLQEQTPEGFRPDQFAHEQNLLVTAAGRSLLVAGCAHRGVVNILAEGRRRLAGDVQVLFGGFHLFEMDPKDPESLALIDATGQALLLGETIYYTGHCTGPAAYQQLSGILGTRLRPMSGGGDVRW